MYVVAGATGHVGSVVAQQLLSKGEKVRVIVRSQEKAASLSAQGAELRIGSLNDHAFLAGALEDAKGFFVLIPPDFNTDDLFATQKKSADTITAAVKQARVPHVVLLSSGGADLPSGTGPIKGLHYFENELRKVTKLTAVRPGYFQENVLTMIPAVEHQNTYPSFLPSSDFAFPMIATKDIGKVAAEALLAPPKGSHVIDVQGPHYSNRQAAELLGKALGKTPTVVDVPPEQHVEAMLAGGLPKALAEAYAEMYQAMGAGKVRPVGDHFVQGTTTLEEVIRAGLQK